MSRTEMQHGRRTRRKPIKACLECNRRKQKCNRQKPCNHCIGRGVEHLCVYSSFHPQRSSGRGRTMYQRERRSNSTLDQSREREEERNTPSTTNSSDYSEANELSLDTLEALGYPPPSSSYTFSTPSNIALSSPELGVNELSISSRSPSRVNRIWPERSLADFLVGLFLQEMNRIYEIIHPLSFKQRYAEWWAMQDNGAFSVNTNTPDEDMEFGILILRLCLLGLQCLPHSRYHHIDIMKSDLGRLEEWFLSTASEIDQSLSPVRKPSIVTVQHRFYHVCYLNNYAKIRESWSVLTVAIKEAHEVGLHLKDPGLPLSPLDLEVRRRTFWNLYVWDRFMCTFFGHWPLIPEGYFDLDLPHDCLDPLTLHPYVLTPFTDRVFHIKLARYQTAFMSPPSWKDDQTNPVTIADFAQQFQEVIVDQLPPPFWLENPDTSWDAVEPNLIYKRAQLHLSIYNTKASLFRAFADPCNSLQQGSNAGSDHGADLLSLYHRRALMDASCKAVSTITHLYLLTADEEGGTAERLFMLPANLIEALACLGVCLLSIQADERRLTQKGTPITPDLDLRYNYASFFDAYGLLCRQAPQYGIARQGVKVLDSLQRGLRHGLHSPELLHASSGSPITLGAFVFDQTPGPCTFQLEHALASFPGAVGEELKSEPIFPLPEWLPSFMKAHGRSWLFHDRAAFGDLL